MRVLFILNVAKNEVIVIQIRRWDVCFIRKY